MYGYVYKGTILTNNKIYIGQHKATSFDDKYHGSGTLWRRACIKHGLDNVKIELLEWCKTREELNSREAYYIQFFNAQDKTIGYNILGNDSSPHACEGANNSMYGKHHSAEARKKMSEAAKRRPPASAETRKKKGDCNRGIPKSEEHRAKISAALKGRHPSDNTTRAAWEANSKYFKVFDSNYNLIKEFKRQKELLAFLEVTYLNRQLKECINSGKLYKGYYVSCVKELAKVK